MTLHARQPSMVFARLASLSRANASDDDDVLAARDRCSPRLRDNQAVYARPHRPCFPVDMIEIVQPSDEIAALDAFAAFQYRFVVSRERCHDETLSIHHRRFDLSARFVMRDGFDRTAQLTVPDRRRHHTMPAVAHPLRLNRSPPPQLCPDRDLAETLGFAGKQPGSNVLVDHDQRRSEPTRSLFYLSTLLRIVEWMEARTHGEPGHIATGVQI